MKIVSSRKVLFILFISFIFMGWNITATVFGESKKPIKIGCLTPLSPPGDPAGGRRIVWGAELGVKFVNEEMGGVLGGRPFELVVEDDAGTPAEGIAGFRRLVQKEGVIAVVGQFHSAVCLAVNHVAAKAGIPLFSTAASASKITETQYPTIFRILGLTPDRAKVWVDFAKKAGFKRIAVVAEDTDYGTGIAKWTEKWGTDAGMEVKSIIFPRTITDLTSVLLDAKTWKPDFLLNAGVGAPAYLMVKNAYELDLFPKIPMLASYGWPIRDEFWDAVGDKGKYIMYSAYYKKGIPMTWLGEWFLPRYEAAHEDPTFYPLNVFGQIVIIAQALNMAQSDDPKDLIKALTKWPYLYWNSVVQFKEEPGVRWHNVSPVVLILQQTGVRQTSAESKLVWPPEMGADGKIAGP